VPTDEESHNRRYADAISAARVGGSDRFQSWFNQSSSVDESLRRGYWDFAVHVVKPEVAARLGNPGTLTALEIGYGGGRLVNAAGSFFGRVIGIDVHGEKDEAAALLEREGKSNVELHQTDGRTIPVGDGVVDFVYSFIVLQHLPSLETFQAYLRETHRVLRRGGVAQLYYGLLRSRNHMRRFREIPEAAVNHVSLQISPRFARRLCQRVGFDVVGHGISYKNVPDGYPLVVGGQAYVALVKR